ncbi:HAMP domain-containing sensor histidine kinase [Hydrogenimonas thermophila]|uniref:sensor histidine kinase n=1 Tax=Hydrogenimonas thermophila TaxID=223786 RepID=UPI0029372B0C|nr:HAMP domain-containing sensor histidine kinase [Hydrogenimonas thermophila]WOE70798.1 HAMP domain-containing sensor histidine kinase [Hydrogenimonas thermophila]WOE73316.1 HAMP domain-containing sensor histidine kinase [Hydrogenimonas thermophila]
MGLSPSEKSSLFRFMAIYLGTGFIVVVAFSTLFYKIESESIKDNSFAKIRMFAMNISASAIDAQMHGAKFEIPKRKDYEYLLLKQNGEIVGGNISDNVDISKDEYVKNGCAYYIDRSVRGHLGIDYIVVRDCTLQQKIVQSGKNVAIIAVIAYGFLILVGWYLGRLFLKPMREKIDLMDRFIKDSTHELNTPVTTMLLALHKIDKKGCKPVYLRSLQMSVRLIGRIYEDLSFLMLKSQVRDNTQIKSVDLSKKIKESIDFFSILSENKKLEILYNLETCIIQADPHHIELLIKNIIDNAIKYTNPGGKIEISLKNCELKVSDTGIGISEEKLSVIFNRFHRENSVSGGFGIGLDIVKTICQIYGFTVNVESNLGKGSSFIVKFANF